MIIIAILKLTTKQMLAYNTGHPTTVNEKYKCSRSTAGALLSFLSKHLIKSILVLECNYSMRTIWQCFECGYIFLALAFARRPSVRLAVCVCVAVTVALWLHQL